MPAEAVALVGGPSDRAGGPRAPPAWPTRPARVDDSGGKGDARRVTIFGRAVAPAQSDPRFGERESAPGPGPVRRRGGPLLPAAGVHAAVPPAAGGPPRRGAPQARPLQGGRGQSGMTLDQLVAGAAQNPDPSMGKPRRGVVQETWRAWTSSRPPTRRCATPRPGRGPFVFLAHMSTGGSPGRPGRSTGRPCRPRPRGSCMPRSGSSVLWRCTTWRQGADRPAHPPQEGQGSPAP
jgi:hypothetical protein